MSTDLKISIEAAENEWREFLEDNDAESLIPNESQRGETKEEIATYEAKKQAFDKVVKAISKGIVVIENGIVTQTLRFPIKTTDGSKTIADKLIYGERWNAKDREEIYKGADPKDPSSAMASQRKLCSKLTGIDAQVLGKLDSVDVKITDQIVSVFFM